MQRQPSSPLEPDARQTGLGSVSAPALLVVLCMMAALPPAAYAAIPETTAHSQFQRPRSDESKPAPAGEPEREPTQVRAVSRVFVASVASLLGGVAAPVALIPDSRLATDLSVGRSPGAIADSTPPVVRPLPERECDLPPPPTIA